MTYKRFLAVLLCCFTLIGLLAGCKEEKIPQPTDENGKPIPTGTLTINMGAVLSIGYDNQGCALRVDGISSFGVMIADNLTGHVGKPCDQLIGELIDIAVENKYLGDSTKFVLIRLGMTSQLPNDKFLDNFTSAMENGLKKANLSIPITYIDKSMMDDDGWFNLEIAKKLLISHLGVEELEAYYGDEEAFNGEYLCTVDAAGERSSHIIDATTGQIRVPTAEELLGGGREEENQEEDIFDDPYFDSGDYDDFNDYDDFGDYNEDIDIPINP